MKQRQRLGAESTRKRELGLQIKHIRSELAADKASRREYANVEEAFKRVERSREDDKEQQKREPRTRSSRSSKRSKNKKSKRSLPRSF